MTREIIHLSYGSRPGHLSTQYFNAQTAYFDYSPNAPEPLVDHDVTWQQGLDPNGRDRYTPRWLAYDVRQGFEGLRTQDDGEDGEDDDDDDADAAQATAAGSYGGWIAQPEITRTSTKAKRVTPYRSLMSREAKGETFDWEEELEAQFARADSDYEDDDDEIATTTQDSKEDQGTFRSMATSKLRRRQVPWSHYLLFEPHPHSLVPVTAAGGMPLESMSSTYPAAEPPTVETFETFEQGYARAKGWEQDQETFDSNLRSLLEAADQPQGFNLVLQASDAWSGFSFWNLEQLLDEYPKLDRLGWALRSGKGVGQLEGDSLQNVSDLDLRLARIRSMNETLSLLMAVEATSLYTPLSVPDLAQESVQPTWSQHLRDDARIRMQNSDRPESRISTALLASQFETATLGAR